MATATKKKTTKAQKAKAQKAKQSVQQAVLAIAAVMMEEFWNLSRKMFQSQKARCKQVYDLYWALKSEIDDQRVDNWFYWVCKEQLGLTRDMAKKMYAAHVLWRYRVYRDIEQLIDPNALTEIAYKSVEHDNLLPGWDGDQEDLVEGREWVEKFMAYVKDKGVTSAGYSNGRYITFSSFRRTDWAKTREAELNPAPQKTQRWRQQAVNDNRKSNAAKLQVIIVDPTNSLTDAQMEAEMLYRCQNKEKFEFQKVS